MIMEKKKTITIILVLIVGFILFDWFIIEPNKTPGDPINKGNRYLGIDVNAAEDGEYDLAFNIAHSIGMDFVTISQGWDDIETSPENYTNNTLDIANVYYPAKNCKLALIITPIDTNVDRRPLDLRDKSFNDTQVIIRFEKLIDVIFLRLNEIDFHSISIGNEIDIYLGNDQDNWSEYIDFYDEITEYIRSNHPNIPIGVKATFNGLMVTNKVELQNINQFSDVVMVTYYPLNADFTVKNPAIVEEDMNALCEYYVNSNISIMEAGYPSSSVIGSSQSKQADFVQKMFQSWDGHSDQIQTMTFVWMHDKSTQEIDAFGNYYGISDQNFKEYLGSLGLRANNGDAKAAWNKLVSESEKRGW